MRWDRWESIFSPLCIYYSTDFGGSQIFTLLGGFEIFISWKRKICFVDIKSQGPCIWVVDSVRLPEPSPGCGQCASVVDVHESWTSFGRGQCSSVVDVHFWVNRKFFILSIFVSIYLYRYNFVSI